MSIFNVHTCIYLLLLGMSGRVYGCFSSPSKIERAENKKLTLTPCGLGACFVIVFKNHIEI